MIPLSSTGNASPHPISDSSHGSGILHWTVWLLALALVGIGLALRGEPANARLFLLLNHFAPQLGDAGSWGSVFGLGAVPLLVVAATGPRRATAVAAVLLALLTCGVLIQLLKYAVNDARPLAVLGDAAMHVVGAHLRGRAMPSGHSAAGACAATMLWCAASVNRRLLVGALMLTLLAVFDAASRVIVGAHWPSDVLAGAGLGMLSGWAVYGPAWSRLQCARLGDWLRRPLGGVLLAVGLVFASWSVWQTRGDYPAARWLYLGFFVVGLAAAMRWLFSQALLRRGTPTRSDSDAAVGAR